MSSHMLEQLFSLPTAVLPKISPDGRWVAFVWYRATPKLDVFVVPTDGSQPPIALTSTPETTWLNGWAPDSRSVVVAQDHDGDDHYCLYRIWLDKPGVMEPLTEDRPPYFLFGGELSADEQLYYAANLDVESGDLLEPQWVYRHDLRTGERHPLAKPQRPHFGQPQVNLQGTHVLYSRAERDPSGQQWWLVESSGANDREIFNFGDAVKSQAVWLPDGVHIAVLSESRDGRKQQHRSLGLYHVPSGQLTWLLDDPARTIEGMDVTPDGLIVVDEMVAARHRPTLLDPQTGVETPVPQVDGNLIPLGRAPDGAWIGWFYSATSPGEIVRWKDGAGDDGELTGLTRVWERTELRPEQLARAESVTWPSSDGLEIQGWLYRAEPNQRTAIIYVHGGPTACAEHVLSAELQYYVSRGFNVLNVNYRGSTGFGAAFRDAIKQDGWGGREQDDIAYGARWLIEQGLADPGSIGVTGVSYGGYSSWCQITHQPPEIIGAAVPVCGMTDLVVDYATTRPDLRSYSEEMLGGSPEQVPQRYYERSPINFVQQIKGELLIVQGEQDTNVTMSNVRDVLTRLDSHGIAYELLTFPDEGHGILQQANQIALYQRIADFFERALG